MTNDEMGARIKDCLLGLMAGLMKASPDAEAITLDIHAVVTENGLGGAGIGLQVIRRKPGYTPTPGVDLPDPKVAVEEMLREIKKKQKGGG